MLALDVMIVSDRSASLDSYIYDTCWFFLIVGINLYIAKLLLFPAIQKPDRHLAMTKGYTDAMKPEKFTGVNIKR